MNFSRNRLHRSPADWLYPLFFLCILILLAPSPGQAGPVLPVYVSDSHAGSFYFLAENAKAERNLKLVLFDIHNDATPVPDSDFIRRSLEELRHGPKSSLFHDWRRRGVIQNYNWLEPLLPRRLSGVIWVPAHRLTNEGRRDLRLQMIREINARPNSSERLRLDFSSFVTVNSFAELRSISYSEIPTVISIDLDYFRGLDAAESRSRFHDILRWMLKLHKLRAVTLAISRSYLASDQEAEGLLLMALDGLTGIINARITVDLTADFGPDRSRRADEYRRQGRRPPAFKLSDASPTLKSFLLSRSDRLIFRGTTGSVSGPPAEWRRDRALQPRIQLRLPSEGKSLCRKDCEVTGNVDFVVEPVVSANRMSPSVPRPEIRWWLVEPAARSYNIVGDYGFAVTSDRLVYFRERMLSELTGKTSLSSYDLNPYFDSLTGRGTIRLRARIFRPEGVVLRSNTLVISLMQDGSLPGRLTALMNLPYIFGSSLFSVKDRNLVDARYGAECSTFLIFGFRSRGYNIPYVEPKRLRKLLNLRNSAISFRQGIAYDRNGPVSITPDSIQNGLILHFGGHVAAVYEDQKPLTLLDRGDLIIHQLEDFPQIIPLGKLKHSNRPFDLLEPLNR